MSSSSGLWSPLERSQFEKGVVQFGWGNWLEITKCIPSRSKCQVKSHAQKFTIHRKEEYAALVRKHAAAMKKGICRTKEPKQVAAVVTPAAKIVKRRPSRSSPVATKLAAPTPVKVRRSSKTSMRAAATVTPAEPGLARVRRGSSASNESAATAITAAPTPVKVRRASTGSINIAVTSNPKPALANAKNLSKEPAKQPTSGAAQLLDLLERLPTKSDTPKEHKLPTKSDTPKEPKLHEDMELEISPTKVDESGVVSELSEQFMQLASSPTKSAAAGKPELGMKLKSSLTSVDSVVTPSPSCKSTAEETEELKGLISSLDYYLDTWDEDSKGVDDHSFALENDILDIDIGEEDIIPGMVDIVEDDSVAPDEQQIRNRALMHLRLQVQPNERALDEITAFIESPPDSPTVENKSTLMRQCIIKLATEASNVGWWRESEKMTPEVVRKAHLEHLVALTFAVLQADAWKRFSEDIVPGETRFNAQDDIRHICHLLPGIWNRVNHSLARDSYALFGAGIDQLERSHAVNKMVRMFDDIHCHSE